MINDRNQEEPIKVVIMGLENAGKTTILDVLSQKIVNIPLTPPNMYPTKGVERRTLIQKNTVVWDFGGQELYRNEYLANPDAYLRSISYVYYVADVQDYYRSISSIMYFMSVFPIIFKKSPDTKVNLLFHKMDPNYDPNKKNLKKLFLDRVEPFLQQYEKTFEMYDTTIYSLTSIKTAFTSIL